jgi:HAD superfamily hydrolase (TIGR01484 family)
MIFASDLDQTLIYSKRHIPDDSRDIINIEKKDDEEISYITSKSISLLKYILENIYFIPVTTRTIEQYKRISLFNEVLKPKYAITDNGAVILVDGEIDKEWESIIKQNMMDNNIYNMFPIINQKIIEVYSKEIFKLNRICDNYFILFIANDRLEFDDKYEKLKSNLKNCGWKLCIQGRKLYAIPDFIDKFKALSYLIHKLKPEKVIASGDSSLDFSLINGAHLKIIPCHGTVRNAFDKEALITKNSGILAGEEILNIVKEQIELSMPPALEAKEA